MHNVNPNTNIPYGVISGNDLSDLVDDIMSNGDDLDYAALKEETKSNLKDKLQQVYDDHNAFFALDEDKEPETYETKKNEFLEAIKEAINTAVDDKDAHEAIDEHELLEAMESDKSAEQIDYDQMFSDLQDHDIFDNGGDSSMNYNYSYDTPHGEVQLHTGELGGAMLIWVIHSPYVIDCAGCSPCVPNAGDLDNPRESGMEAYCLPPDDLPEDYKGVPRLLDADIIAKHKK